MGLLVAKAGERLVETGFVTSSLRHHPKQREISALIFLLLCGLIVAGQVVLAEVLDADPSRLLKLDVVIISVLLLAMFQFLRYRIFDPLVLWFFLLTLFMSNRVFLDILGIEDFGRIRNFVTYSIPTHVEARAILNLLIAMLAFCIGWIVRDLQQPLSAASRKGNAIPINTALVSVGQLGLIVCFPLIMGHYFLVASFVAENGYLAYHLGTGPSKSIPVYASEQMSWFFLAVFLSGIPSRRRFVTILTIIVIPLLMTRMFSGARGFSMVMLISVFWYWHSVYGKAVRLWLWIPVGIVIVGGLLQIGAYRGGVELDYQQLGALLLFFIDGQGSSVTTLLVSIENVGEKPLSEYGLTNILAELFMQIDKLLVRISGGTGASQLASAETYGYSGYLVTQALNKDVLASGASLGTSYITELFLAGREMAQIAGGLLFGYIFNCLYQQIHKGRLQLLTFLILLPQLLYLPRMSIFSVISANFVPIILLLVFMVARIFSRSGRGYIGSDKAVELSPGQA